MRKPNYLLKATEKFGQYAKVIFPVAALAILVGCGGGGSENTTDSDAAAQAQIEEAKRAVEAENAAKENSIGVGPVTTVELGPFNQAMADEGKAIFESKCSACHRITEEKVVGPGMKGITKRRKAEWIMNMIINPEEMTKKDPTAQELLAEHLTQMTNQNVNEQDARKLLEYMRQIDEVETKPGAEAAAQ